MKTYYISLDRSKERARHIQRHVDELQLNSCKISAVDGKLLTREDIVKVCNIEQVDKLRWWLTDGAIGCALSHKIAYKKFLETTDEAAFIIEDDVVLPKNIGEILALVSQEIKSNEVVLLYYTSFKPAEISSVGGVELSNLKSGLYFPMDLKQPITAAAYCIGREAAKGMLKANTPIALAADSWNDFYLKGAFSGLRLLYPSPIVTRNFKSSIDYFKKGSLKGRLSEVVNKYKVPIVYQYVKKRRADTLDSMLGHFTLVNKESPLFSNTSVNTNS